MVSRCCPRIYTISLSLFFQNPDNMLLDARGHLRLTDLGLCKKVGEVSKSEEPEHIIATMLKDQTLSPKVEKIKTSGSSPAIQHRKSDDVMAMSIDDTVSKRDAKTRREMAYSTVGTPDYIAPYVFCCFFFFKLRRSTDSNALPVSCFYGTERYWRHRMEPRDIPIPAQ